MKKIMASGVAALAALGAAYLFVPPPHQAAAQFADQGTWGGTSGGSANAQTITIANLSGNKSGIVLRFTPGFTNTGPMQINVNGLGLVSVQRPSSLGLVALSGQEFFAGEPSCVMYNGSVYVQACNVDVTPIGKIDEIRGTTSAPRGRLIEDGSCVSQTTYAALFSVIGTSYGSCGAGLFALPNSKSQTIFAYDNQGAGGAASRITNAGSGCNQATTVGGTCGSQNNSLVATQIPNLTVTTTPGGGLLLAQFSGSIVDGQTSNPAAGGFHFPGGNGTWSGQNTVPGTATGSGSSTGNPFAILPPASFALRVIKF